MKTIIRVIAVVIIIGLAWYVINNPKTIQTTQAPSVTNSVTSTAVPSIPPVPVSDGWKRYDNTVYAFSIQYPENFAVNETYRYTALGLDKVIAGVSFTVPLTLTKGTNLSTDTYVSVERFDLREKACTIQAFLDKPDHQHIEQINGRDYSVADSSGAGAGNLYEETVYATTANDHCYGLRLFIHSTNIANYSPGTIQAFDRPALLKTFEQFRDSFQPGI